MAIKDDSVAQLVEHIPFKDGVLGPNPSWVTKNVGEVLTASPFFFDTVAQMVVHSVNRRVLGPNPSWVTKMN